MHADLHQFLSRLIGTIVLALVPVVFTAFVSMPLSLSRHPGELAQVDAHPRHMT
jgi:ABC-type phosphate/phosphonate transport system permease subunit